MRAELFDKLNAAEILLPKLDHAVNGARDEEFGVRGQRREAQLLAVHERLGIAGCARQRGDVELLVGQLALLALRRRRRKGRAKVVVIIGRRVTLIILSANVREELARRNIPSCAAGAGFSSSASISVRVRLPLTGDSDRSDMFVARAWTLVAALVVCNYSDNVEVR